MNMNFWKNLPQHFAGLSPMDGVTDFPYREIQAKYGHPDVMYTEFVPVEGITHGATRLFKDFLYSEQQHPIVAQIYGHTPEDFRTVSTIVAALGFDGVDINMGCPAKNVTHLGSGAALIQTPKLAQEIIRNVQFGVQDWVNGKEVKDLNLCEEIKDKLSTRISSLTERHQIPVSVKTRLGYQHPVHKEWIETLLEMNVQTIALHGRVLKQFHSGEVRWDLIAECAEIAKQTDTLILGNGDITSIQQGKELCEKYHIDGFLIGRASMGNPWIFRNHDVTIEERFQVAIEHAKLYENTFSGGEKYNFLPMRKHLGWYIKEFRGASEIRQQLIRTNSWEEVRDVLNFSDRKWPL